MDTRTKFVSSGRIGAGRRRVASFVILLLAAAMGIVVWSASAQAATIYPVTATIAVGDEPLGVALDPSTHTAFVTNYGGPGDGSVSVIDGATDNVTHTIGVGESPFGVAVDPTRHVAYVANQGDNTVSVVDEGTSALTHTLGVGDEPEAVDVDPATHTAWVADDSNLSEIDEGTNTVTHTIAMSDFTTGVAVDTGTHTVYVSHPVNDTVQVIDEASSTVTHSIHVGNHPLNDPGADPAAIAVDSSTHTAYVVDEFDSEVVVIDEATNTVTHTIAVGDGPNAVAVDPGTHTAYVSDTTDNKVSVIDEVSNTVIAQVQVGENPTAVAVDPVSHAVYVANGGNGTVSVISPTASQLQYQAITFTSTPPAPYGLGGISYEVTATGGGSGNPVTFSTGNVSSQACAIHDHGNSSATVDFTGAGTCDIAADQAGNAQYVAAPEVWQRLIAVPGPAVTLDRLGGFDQSTVVGTPFAKHLFVRARDANLNATPGVAVTFTVTAGSAHFPSGSTATVISNSTDGSNAIGQATSPRLIAGPTAGPVTVTVTSGTASATFAETVTDGTGTGSADLAVALSAPAQVQTGTKLALVVTVSNAGPSASGKVLTSVPIPPGFTVTKTGGGVKNGSTVMFSLRDGLAVNASHSYTINLTTTRKMSSKATFHASTAAAVPDPNLADNSASDTIQIN